MNLRSTALIAAAMFGALLTAPHAAHAVVAAPGLAAPSMLEDVQCRTVRERVRLPNGRVVHRTVRRCAPQMHRPCRMVRERVVTPSGRVIHRTVRRCR
ncbi:MAG TPA: hypothetical protein VNQ99_10390 [Xanthobacteraceae bacterium]|nr:hypothetical protein [Xanthobacteraceae bacterium]